MRIVDSLNSTISRDGGEVQYIYRLTRSEYKGSQAYGIEVERQDSKDGQTVNIERDDIKLISNNRYKVNELLRLLYKNQVSPIHLTEILGEYVDEYISDFNNIQNDRIIN